jgi:CubicO group peptidase (beta-lactamase class C family)
MVARAILCICCLLALDLGPAYAAGGTVAAPAPTCKTDLTSQLQILNVPGLAAAIVKDDRIVCTAVAGLANIEQTKPVTPDTLFLIASVSKTITATALMQLFDQDKFELDDDINDYLPFKVKIPASPDSPITFRQLLTHTSSIKDNPTYVNCPASCDYGSSPIPFVTRGVDSPISLAKLVRGYLTAGGAYYDEVKNFEPEAPGTIAEYSNMGIVLAGYLVEVISGVSFDQFCKDHIFTPLGMHKTSWRLAGIDQSMLAMPYNKSSFGYVPYGQYGEPDYPDGMLRTSINELAQFLISYMQGGRHNDKRILKSKTVEAILESQTPLRRSHGLGWIRQTINGETVWGHDGDDHGAGAKMWFDPENKAGVILMTNGIWIDNDDLLTGLFQEADR